MIKSKSRSISSGTGPVGFPERRRMIYRAVLPLKKADFYECRRPSFDPISGKCLQNLESEEMQRDGLTPSPPNLEPENGFAFESLPYLSAAFSPAGFALPEGLAARGPPGRAPA